MKNNKILRFVKEKAVIVALVVCLLAAGTITGIYTMRQSKVDEDTDYVDLSELQGESKEDLQEANNDQVTNEGPELEDHFAKAEDEEETETEDETTAASGTIVSSTTTISLNFSETDTLTWPINGNVIMNYSMDKTIHFSTLDVYKYNPAIIISGEVNTKVLAAANGKVTDISVNEETGNTITMDLGNGYEAIYGQLKEIPLSVGDMVETNELIGYVSEPTKYYTVEGSNVYFKLMKDGEPVNPMSYLE